MRRCFELISRKKYIIFGIIVNLLWRSCFKLVTWAYEWKCSDLSIWPQTKMKAKEQQRKMLINEKRTDNSVSKISI